MRRSLLYSLFMIVTACQQSSPEPVDLGYDYMPLEIGRFWVYTVEETLYYGAGDSESSTFYFRDIIADSYIREDGRLHYKVNRGKSYDQSDWQNHSVYTLQVNQQALLKSGDNLTTVPLIFPPTENKSWDGNVYNAEGIDDYMLELQSPYELGEKTYASAAKVVQELEDDEITIRDKRYEVYARGVGMIEQYIETLNYCSRNDCLGEQIIESGRLSHLKLINNGHY